MSEILNTLPTGQIRWRIFATEDSNDADFRKDVPFWCSIDILRH